MTPPVRGTEGSVSAPETHADAGAPTADASPPPPSTTTDAGAPPAHSPQDEPQWVLFGRASMGPADHGGRNGTIFAYDPISQFGDWINFGVAAGVLRDVTSGNVRLRLGGSLGYERFNGGQSTSGSHLNIFSINPRAELDWRRVWGTGAFAGPSRLGIEFGLGYGFGTTTVDGGFQLHNQSGFALAPRADLNLFNVRVGDLEMGLDFYAGSSAILGTEHNSAFAEFGGEVSFRTPLSAPPQVVEEACSVDRRGEIVQRIHALQSQSQELREENAQNALFLDAIRVQLENQGVTREDLVASLRRGYESYLEHREAEPVADAAERTRLAQERFPDDFDPYTWPEVATVTVPEPLPQDCEALEGLRTRLEDERADLREQKGLIDGLVRMALTRLGVPATAAPQLVRAITRLSEIHFITSRPMGAPDSVTVREADIAPINAAAEAWGRDHHGEIRPQVDIDAAFHAIFPRTHRAPTDTTGGAHEYSPSLEVIRQIAETLRSPDMRGAHFYVVGHTDSRGDDAMNQRLSLRRAEAIRDALIFYGVDPQMITPIGRGESQLVYYYDQRHAGGTDAHRMAQAEVTMLRRDGIQNRAGHPDLDDEIRGRQSTNRRIEMFVCMPSAQDPTCQQLDAEIHASSQPVTQSSGASSPVQVVTSGSTADAGTRTDGGSPRGRGQGGSSGAAPTGADGGATPHLDFRGTTGSTGE